MTGRQVVIQVKGFTLFEVDGDAVLIVGIVDRSQLTR